MSLRARITISVIRRHFSLNPEIEVNQVEKCQSLNKMSGEKTSRGYVLAKGVTPSGTRYEKIVKKGGGEGKNLMLYLHGGAYVVGLVSLYRKMAGDFARAVGDGDVILLDYDCAPEAKYPTQLNQALDIWNYITTELGYRAENITVGGDSAGGNLTLALLLKLRDEGRDMPRAAVLHSPWADMTGSGDSYIFNYSNDAMFGLKGSSMDEEKRKKLLNCSIYNFVGDADRTDPYVSPVYGEYHNFPKTFFTVGSHEMLLSDTMTIVRKLKNEGNEPELVVGDGMFHVYPLAHSLLPEGKKAYKAMLNFIERQYKR